jgi:hypothetical protein
MMIEGDREPFGRLSIDVHEASLLLAVHLVCPAYSGSAAQIFSLIPVHSRSKNGVLSYA